MKKRISKIILLALTFAVAVSAFSITAFAENALSVYIYDGASLLTEEQYNELNTKAAEISHRYRCAVHIVTTDDPEVNESNIQQYAEDMYLYNSIFGYGSGRDGFMLMIDRYNRCYWLQAYGEYANFALTDYGKEQMSSQFTDNFGSDDWYGGLADYISYAETVLSAAESGKPVDIYRKEKKDMGAGAYGISAVIGAIASWIVCGKFKREMHTAVHSSEADRYMDNINSEIYFRDDNFVFAAHAKEKLESSGQGTTVNSRGFSGKGGKF